MGRQSKLVFGAVFAIVLAVSSASQITLGRREILQAKILSDLKEAQQAAGIFVDDSDLFLNPQSHGGRKLLQSAELATILSNPTVLAVLTGLFVNGSVVGGFPGVAMSLPGGSPFGYAPTSDSYCLFSTTNRSSATPVSASPGTSIPPTFSCVAGSTAAPGGFLVSYSGTEYACVAVGAPASGRKLLQNTLSPEAAALLTPTSLANLAENLLNALGLPVWNCVTATTPDGNTTLGQTATAILNDLGVIAEHFLVQLNSNGGLTYQQQIQNDFVSLTNPLYPTGPRLNFSIDFKSLAKDQALFRSIFGFQPPSPPPPAPTALPTTAAIATVATPATPSTGGTVPYGSTPSNTGGSTSSGSQTSVTSQATSGGSTSGGSSATAGTTTTTTTANPPATTTTTTTTPAAAVPPTPMATLSAFDGYLSNCQVVLGSAPGLDGNFNQVTGFQAVILNGQSTISMNATSTYNNSISYIIPSSKVQTYAPLTVATASQAQFCYDIATLLPVYNPVASTVVADATGMAANAITTVAVFGQALGVTASQVVASLGINIPSPDSLWTYNAIAAAANGSTDGQAFMRSNSAVQNLVTSGANMLSNDSALYASYAIIMNQALAQKILYSPAGSTGRKLLQSSAPPAVDLTNATTLESIYSIAQQMAESSSEPDTLASLNPGLTQADLAAVATAVANLNSATSTATDVTTTQLSTLYGENYLAQQVSALATGAISESDFATATSTDSISKALAGTLPGTILPAPTVFAPPPASLLPQTQSSSSAEKSTEKSSGGGLSHSGKVALATVFPIVAVIAIVAVAAFFVSRRNSHSETSSSNVWYRRPFACSGPTV